MGSSRVSTGIEGFDRLVEGGFPRGDTILLIGNPGTGKTGFSAQFLYKGLVEGECGIYVSFSEGREAFFRNMNSIGLDFAKYEKEGKFRLVDVMGVGHQGIEEILTTILEEVSSLGAKRLVIDSFTAITQALPGKADSRMILHTSLGKISRLKGVTVLVISERPFGVEFGHEPEEFVADGVVALRYLNERGRLRRRLQIIKMRGTNVVQTEQAYAIGNKGITILSPSGFEIPEEASTERLTTGIGGLDEMLHGGLFRGSSTLISGYPGTGKSTFALSFIYEGARRNQRGLFISFEEPVKQLLRQASIYGWDLERSVRDHLVVVKSFYPEDHEPDELQLQLRNLVTEFKPERIVLDSISALERILVDFEFLSFVKGIVASLKATGITVVLTSATSANSETQEAGTSTIVDNIVSLRNVEIEGSLRKSVIVFKARSSPHDKGLREFEITSEGVKVGLPLSNFEGITSGVARRISHSVGEAIEKIDEIFPDDQQGDTGGEKKVRT